MTSNVKVVLGAAAGIATLWGGYKMGRLILLITLFMVGPIWALKDFVANDWVSGTAQVWVTISGLILLLGSKWVRTLRPLQIFSIALFAIVTTAIIGYAGWFIHTAPARGMVKIAALEQEKKALAETVARVSMEANKAGMAQIDATIAAVKSNELQAVNEKLAREVKIKKAQAMADQIKILQLQAEVVGIGRGSDVQQLRAKADRSITTVRQEVAQNLLPTHVCAKLRETYERRYGAGYDLVAANDERVYRQRCQR